MLLLVERQTSSHYKEQQGTTSTKNHSAFLLNCQHCQYCPRNQCCCCNYYCCCLRNTKRPHIARHGLRPSLLESSPGQMPTVVLALYQSPVATGLSHISESWGGAPVAAQQPTAPAQPVTGAPCGPLTFAFFLATVARVRTRFLEVPDVTPSERASDKGSSEGTKSKCSREGSSKTECSSCSESEHGTTNGIAAGPEPRAALMAWSTRWQFACTTTTTDQPQISCCKSRRNENMPARAPCITWHHLHNTTSPWGSSHSLLVPLH